MCLKNILLLLLMIISGTSLMAQKYTSGSTAELKSQWEGNEFSTSKTFWENIADAPQFSFFRKFASPELREQLKNEEMVTVFAFTDAAFLKLPEKRRDSILTNTQLMDATIEFMMVPGRLDSHALKVEVNKRDGNVRLNTLNGEALAVRESNGILQLVDSQGRVASIIAADIYHKNGFLHIVDGVVFPEAEK